ncbi:DUF1707 domain-containing protein [Mariniluteicoccus flavus]
METSAIQVRVGDRERSDLVNELGDHFAAGRLTRDELDERVTSALGARTQGELDELRRDLPAPNMRLEQAPSGDDLARRAKALWFSTGLLPWAVMAVVFVLIWVMTGARYFWPVWPIMGWGIGVVTTGVLAHRLPAEYLRRKQNRRTACPGAAVRR